MPVPSKESEPSSIYMLGASIWPLSMIFLLDFGTVLTVWYYLSFISRHAHSMWENCDLINWFNPTTFCVPVPSHDLDFQHHTLWSF